MRWVLYAVVFAAGCAERNPRFDDDAGTGTGSDSGGSASMDGGADGADDGGDHGDGGGVGSGGSGADDGTDTGGMDSGGTTGGVGTGGTTAGVTTTTSSGTTSSGTTSSGTTSGGPTDDGGGSTGNDGTTGGGLDSACLVGDSALVACYEFEVVDSGTLVDESGNANHGASSGVSTVAGISGKAGLFTAISKLGVLDDPTLNPSVEFTIDAWIRPDAFPAGPDPDGVVDKDNQWWIKVTDNSKVHCGAAGIGSLTGGSLQQGVWTHVTCLYDGDKLRMYQDGQARGMVGSPRPLGTGAAELIVGNESPSLGHPFRGRIDRLRIWSRGLTPKEVCEAAGQPSC